MPKIAPPNDAEIKAVLNTELFPVWTYLIQQIEGHYDLDREWHTANKGQHYELKFRRGGKTLVSLFPHFPNENTIGVMVIFGKDEREKFEANDTLSEETKAIYQAAKTFHDGKWVMFEAPSESLEKDLLTMLAIKRKPNKIT